MSENNRAESKMKLISAIVPVYNAETFLKRCIDSICSQTYKNWELILVDDGSSDNSYMICQDYAMRMPKKVNTLHQSNSGAGMARNAGLSVASGDYVVFVEDYFDLLSKQTADVVFIDVADVDESQRIVKVEKISNFSDCSRDSLIRSQMTGKMQWGG